MQPLVRAAVAVTALSALTRAADWAQEAGESNQAAPTAASATDALGSPCPPGTLPDANVCIPVPTSLLPEKTIPTWRRAAAGGPRGYDRIPRRPDRPSDYRSYRLPVPLGASGLISGHDLPAADASGIAIAQPRGTQIKLVSLEHQKGPSVVLYVGRLFEGSVVTVHSVRQAGQLRDYLVIHGNLQNPAPGLKPGVKLKEGETIGGVGDSASPGRPYLRLEVRQVRSGIEPKSISPDKLTDDAHTVACDPRNVLQLGAR